MASWGDYDEADTPGAIDALVKAVHAADGNDGNDDNMDEEYEYVGYEDFGEPSQSSQYYNPSLRSAGGRRRLMWWEGKDEGREPANTRSWSATIEGRKWYFTTYTNETHTRGDACFLYRGPTPLWERTKDEWTTILPCPYAARASRVLSEQGSVDQFSKVTVVVPGTKENTSTLREVPCHWNYHSNKSHSAVFKSVVMANTPHKLRKSSDPLSWAKIVDVEMPVHVAVA